MLSFTAAQAEELLRFHSGRHENINHPKWCNGFLGALRPYQGLRDENFHEVIACLKTLAPQIEAGTVDRQVLTDIWGICHLARAWGVEPWGMLRSNNLISESDAERLNHWVTTISYATFCLLDGSGEEVAFEGYEEA